MYLFTAAIIKYHNMEQRRLQFSFSGQWPEVKERCYRNSPPWEAVSKRQCAMTNQSMIPLNSNLKNPQSMGKRLTRVARVTPKQKHHWSHCKHGDSPIAVQVVFPLPYNLLHPIYSSTSQGHMSLEQNAMQLARRVGGSD